MVQKGKNKEEMQCLQDKRHALPKKKQIKEKYNGKCEYKQRLSSTVRVILLLFGWLKQYSSHKIKIKWKIEALNY